MNQILNEKRYYRSALEQCEALSRISEMDRGIFRQYLTPEHARCNQQVSAWMEQAGMHTWQDSVGNQWGRLPSQIPDAPRLVLGSHLDTVPNAGAFDGILGVTLAIQVAAWCRDHAIKLPFHLDVVGFCDEEGSRFGVTLIGSRALAGSFDPSWLTCQDKQGISMANAMKQFGLRPDDVQQARLEKEDLLGYWEIHIEQGPVLEDQNHSVGIVTGISGARRGYLTVTGQAGHAGTTPMNLRKDAVAGAAEVILAIEQLATEQSSSCVATVGQIEAHPSAVNVIAGSTTLSLDIRSMDDHARDQLIEKINTEASNIAARRQLSLHWSWHHQAGAVPCCHNFQEIFEKSINQCDLPIIHLPSGAGHDAMALAEICPVAMLFIRSPEGLSHHPDERVLDVDVRHAFDVICNSLLQLSEQQ